MFRRCFTRAAAVSLFLLAGSILSAQNNTGRISGTVTEFKPGSRLKRSFIGFGAGSTVVRALVRLSDAAGGQHPHRRQLVAGRGGGAAPTRRAANR